MKYVGLQTQIWNNNLKSTILLIMFPLVILGLAWLFIFYQARILHNRMMLITHFWDCTMVDCRGTDMVPYRMVCKYFHDSKGNRSKTT
jgi:hypothetical protein